MNKNIEVINEHLWAVKFSFLPFIPEIEGEPEPTDSAAILKNGVLLLNKDYPGFEILKDSFPKIMQKKDKQFKRDLKNLELIKDNSNWHNLYYYMHQVEEERRVKTNGNNKNSYSAL